MQIRNYIEFAVLETRSRASLLVLLDLTWAVESQGILGGVGVGKNIPTPSPPKILIRYSKSSALIATIAVRLTLKYRL
jgi:hypothetical protein